jgi:hypothetical protein
VSPPRVYYYPQAVPLYPTYRTTSGWYMGYTYPPIYTVPYGYNPLYGGTYYDSGFYFWYRFR